MMADKELMTVKEFATAAGVSMQAIYKGLNNQLKEYSTIDKGRKMLKIQALKDIYGIDWHSEVEQPFQPEEQKVVQPDSTELNRIIEILQEQIKQKDIQIAELHKLLDQQQQIQAMQNVLYLEQKKNPTDENIQDAGDQVEVEPVKPPAEEEPEKKRTLMERFIGFFK